MSHPLYEIKDLKFRYGDRFELDIPDLIIESGSSVGLMGPNGGGKSTLLKILSFIEAPDEGTITFEGTPITGNETGSKRNITILLQDPYLLKRSVFDNVAYGLKIRNEKSNLRKKVHEALEMVGLSPHEFASRQWYELSGGEAQRVALAARLILKPRALLLDEPTASVDQQSSILMKKAITICREEFGTSLIIASHDRIWLNSVTDTAYKVFGGHIVGSGAENLIPGPWEQENGELYFRHLSDEQVIYAKHPPQHDATAILNPSDIVLSVSPPEKTSAQNNLHGTITQMTIEEYTDFILVEVSIGGLPIISRLTHKGARQLELLPGKKVWIIFKASAVNWY